MWVRICDFRQIELSGTSIWHCFKWTSASKKTRRKRLRKFQCPIMTVYDRWCCVAFLAEISAAIGLLHACKKKPMGNHATVLNWTKGAKASRGKVGTEVDRIWPTTSGRAMHFIANISTQGFDFRIGPQISCDLATTVAEQKSNLVDVRKCLWVTSVSSASQGHEILEWKS